MTNAEKLALQKHACRIRLGVIESTHSAKSGHPGGSLSIAEVLSFLYFREMGHPNMNTVPGVDMSTGSLGQGISAACGMALGAKVKGLDQVRVYAIMGDGEIEEGECWEAFMFAAHYKLDNLCVFLDLNHLQIDGAIEKVMNSAPQDQKLEAFGFKVLSVDGHDLDQIEAAVDAFHAEKGRPTFIILNTTKGKGVSYMENNANWHGKAPGDADYRTAMDELNAALAKLEKEEG